MSIKNSNSVALILLGAVCLMIFIVNLDITAVNLSLVPMAQDIVMDLNTSQWVLSAYTLVMSALIISSGRLADRCGQRRFCLYGITLFLLGSLFAGLSDQAWMVIASRALQGIGGACYIPTLYALIFANLPAQRHGLAMGALGTAAGLGAAFGPTISGIILDSLNWRWIFFINIPLCLLVLFIVSKYVAKEPKPENLRQFDYLGSVILGIAVCALLYPLGKIHEWGGFNAQAVGLLSFAVFMFGGFFMHIKNKADAVVPMQLLRNRNFIGVCSAFTLQQYGFASNLILIGLYLQNILQFSVMNAGLIFMAITLTFSVVSPLAGRITDRVGPRLPTLLGFTLLILDSLFLRQLSSNTPIEFLLISFILLGTGLGLSFSPLSTAMMRAVEPQEINTASGIFTMFALFGCSLGIMLPVVLLQYFGGQHLLSLVGNVDFSPEGQQIIHGLLGSMDVQHVNLAGLETLLAEQVMQFYPAAFSYGMSQAYWLNFVLFLVGAGVVFFRVKIGKPVAATAALPETGA